MGVREMELESVDWIHLTQDEDWWQALVTAAMNLRNPYDGPV
jgi:hypothetical protein